MQLCQDGQVSRNDGIQVLQREKDDKRGECGRRCFRRTDFEESAVQDASAHKSPISDEESLQLLQNFSWREKRTEKGLEALHEKDIAHLESDFFQLLNRGTGWGFKKIGPLKPADKETSAPQNLANEFSQLLDTVYTDSNVFITAGNF